MIKKTIKCTYKAISKDFGSVYRWFKDDYDWCMDNISAVLHLAFLCILHISPFVTTSILTILKMIPDYVNLIMLPIWFVWMYIINKYVDCSDYWTNVLKVH